MAGNDLVARLGVDDSAWTSGFAKARSTAGSFSSGISSLFSPIGVAVGAAGAAIGAAFGAGASVSAYKESIQAQRKLSAVLEATGGAAGVTTGEISALAADLQKTTNFEDDATTAAAGMLAAFTNVRGDSFKGAIVQAQNLSAVMGGDLEGSVKLLGKALNNPSEGLKKLARSGITFTDQQKQQIATMQAVGDMAGAQGIILGAVEGRFGGAAEAMADPWTRLQNTFGDVAENIGSVLLPSINVIADGINYVLGFVVDAGQSFKDFGIEAAVVLENMGGIISLSAQQWQLFFVQIGLGAAHFFTEVIPAYLSWFGQNWQEIFITAASNTLTVFENLATNIQSIWTSVMNFFAGKPLEFNWKPLSDGFINTIGKLPDIPPRAITELEKGMASSIASSEAALGASMLESRDRITKQFDTNSKVPAGTIAPDITGGPKAEKEKADKGKSDATLLGSKEAASIFTRGIGGGEDTGKKTLAVAEKALTVQEQIRDNIAKMDQPDEVVDAE